MDSQTQIKTLTDVAVDMPITGVTQYLDAGSPINKLVWLPAIIVTALITTVMVILVTSPQAKLQTKDNSDPLNFIRVKQQEVVKTREFKTEKSTPPRAPVAPALDVAATSQNVQIEKIPVKLAALPEGHVSVNAGFGFGLGTGMQVGNFQETEYLPLVKIAPAYPQSGLNYNIEGYCTVEFTVTPKGTTRDIRVLEDQCTHAIFMRPSIMAAKKFRYQPRIVDGKAIEVHGIVNRFNYTIVKKRW